jgi:dihydrofolate synthase/folylpolyglutamate synthase
VTLPSTGAGRLRAAGAPWVPAFELAPADMLPFDEAVARIEASLRLGIDPSLEPVRAVLAELGHPERAFACVQVAGTNGKTSTARYTAALLAGAGLRCGLYTSPHLVDYTERVEVAGAPVSRAAFARGVSWALAAWARLEARGAAPCAQGITEFELLTAAAMATFAEEGVQVAVLEVGLGGRWDATSAVDTCGCAVTGIGLDHTRILGDTLEAIAAEKAAVIRPGAPCVLGTNAVRPAGVLKVMLERCEEAGVVPSCVVDVAPGGPCPPEALAGLPWTRYAVAHEPRYLGDELAVNVQVAWIDAAGERRAASYPGMALRAPLYQAQNVACALALATCLLDRPLDANAACASLAACAVPGRFEVVRAEPLAVLDACHNPQSAEAFAGALCSFEPDRLARPTLLLGCLADKDWHGIARVLVPLFERVVVTTSGSSRALPPAELAAEVARVAGRAPEAVYPTAAEALAALAGEPFVCCGTITLIGEVKALLQA